MTVTKVLFIATCMLVACGKGDGFDAPPMVRPDAVFDCTASFDTATPPDTFSTSPPDSTTTFDTFDSGPGNDDSGGQPDTFVTPSGPWFTNAMVWDHPVDGLEPDYRSAAMIKALDDRGGWGNSNIFQIDFSIVVLRSDSGTPYRYFEPNDDFFFGDCDQIAMPVPADGALEGEDGLSCESDGDCHLIVLAPEALYEMWRADIDGDLFRGGCLAMWDRDKTWSERLRGEGCSSADAAGLPIAPLLFTADEVASGEIKHAIRFILPNTRIAHRQYVRPGTHATGAASATTNGMPYGVRLRLRADFPLDDLPSDGARVVAKALQTYGMILADGGQIALTAASDRDAEASWDGLLEPRDLEALQVTDFDVVELGDLIDWTGDCVRGSRRLARVHAAPHHPDDRTQLRRHGEAFIIAFAKAAHAAGTPAHRLEDLVGEIALRLGITVAVFSTPTMLTLGFGPTDRQRTVLLRVEPADVHLARLDDLNYVARRVLAGAWLPEEGLAALERVKLATPVAPVTHAAGVVVMWLLLSATLARFFGGGLLEIAAAAVIGAAIGALSLAWPRLTTGAPVFELLASAVAALLAAVASKVAADHGLRLSAYVTMLSGVVALLPGFTLTVAVTELASHHLASGTARAVAAAVTLLQMAVGVALGTKLAEAALGAIPNAAPVELPEWTEIALLPIAAVVMALFSYARRERLFAIVVVSILAYFGARWGGEALGPELGAAVGAFVVGIASRVHAELAECPQLVTLVPATLMLVPGSFGFRSVSLFLGSDVTSGMDAAMRMLLIAMAIAAGLLVAQALGHRRPAL